MKFTNKVSKLMAESLLEGNADYGDVMDALKKLEEAVMAFQHVYPADRGSHVHAAFKTEIERMTARVHQWTKTQNSHTNGPDRPHDSVSEAQTMAHKYGGQVVTHAHPGGRQQATFPDPLKAKGFKEWAESQGLQPSIIGKVVQFDSK